jgi:alanyl-tRNA synthetase
VLQAIGTLLDEKNNLQKQIERFSRESARIFKQQLISKLRKTGKASVITALAEEPVNDMAIIKDVAFQLKSEINDLILIIGTITANKPFLAISISDPLIAQFGIHAGEIVRVAAAEFNGGGGGQPFFANAGGKDIEKLDAAMQKAEELALSKL